MAFGETHSPATLGTLNVGDSSVDVSFIFSGVVPDTAGEAVVLFSLGPEVLTVELPVTFGEPKPVVGTITTPPGLAATIVSADDNGAVIRFTRS